MLRAHAREVSISPTGAGQRDTQREREIERSIQVVDDDDDATTAVTKKTHQMRKKDLGYGRGRRERSISRGPQKEELKN